MGRIHKARAIAARVGMIGMLVAGTTGVATAQRDRRPGKPTVMVDAATAWRTTLAAACPQPPVGAWIAPRAKKIERENPNTFVKGFDTAFAPLVEGATPDQQPVVAAGYRACLTQAESGVRASPMALTMGHENVSCSTCTVYFSPIALQVPRLRLLAGLTYLMPERLADQNWLQAANMMRAGIMTIPEIQSGYGVAARAAYRAKAAHRRAARERAEMFTALVGAAVSVATRNQSVMTDTMRAMEVGRSENEAVITAIRANQSRMFRVPAGPALTDDGVRVTVPRILPPARRIDATGTTTVAYRAMGAMDRSFPLSPIVQIRNAEGTCTGSFVGPRLVLTNRHCVADTAGTLKASIGVEWRYFTDGYTGGTIDPGIGEKMLTWKVKSVRYPPRDHEKDHSADWALIETETASTVGFLNVRDPATITDLAGARVAIAGFSGDLNDGRYVTMDWGCPVSHDVASKLLHYGCLTFLGSSGSPVVLIDRQGMRRTVIGVNSRAYRDTAKGEKTAAADPAMFTAIREIRLRQGLMQ